MNVLFGVTACLVVLLGTSCAALRPKATSQPSPIVTPDTALAGKIVAVNNPGRFVVVNFPVGRMAAVGQVLSVYRDGLKVGELKVSGPQRDDNIVADLAAGEARVGDAVRDR